MIRKNGYLRVGVPSRTLIPMNGLARDEKLA